MELTVTLCFFASDLHGRVLHYVELFRRIEAERPAAVFLGGDLLPAFTGMADESLRFVEDVLIGGFQRLQDQLGKAYPRVFVILGNDDPRHVENECQQASQSGLWDYIHGAHSALAEYDVYGYACVPPTPFLSKDWERYDVSRYVDPGCVSPEEGFRTVPIAAEAVRYATIAHDLEALAGDRPMERAIFLFHAPPHRTNLDRASLDGRAADYAPLDVHVGSIAVRRFIESRQPLLTLHGHIHVSARLTKSWRDQLGRTHMLSAAHDGPELALVRFALENPGEATREVIPTAS